MQKKELKNPKQAKKNEIEDIKKLFLQHYPDSVTELEYKNLYELVIAVMLSAQCTDKRVANLNDVKELIKSCSFFNNKAKNAIAMAQMVEEKFDGEIPLNQKDLIKLPGVGQKTANVVLIEYTGANLMAVDTHVFRVAHRLGLSKAKNVKDTEADLVKKFKTNLHQLHQAMVLFGRYKCKALKPECEDCFLKNLCKTKMTFKA